MRKGGRRESDAFSCDCAVRTSDGSSVGADLAQPAGQSHRAFHRRQCDGHPRANVRAEAAGGLGTARGGREPSRRRRHDWRGDRREVDARRLHAAGSFRGLRDESIHLPRAALRLGEGFRRHRAARRTAKRARRRFEFRHQVRGRPDRAGQAETRRLQLRICRHRQWHARQRGEIQARDRHRCGARPVQGDARGAEGHDRRSRHVLLLADIGGAATDQGRQGDRTRGVQRATLERVEGRADDRRSRGSTTTCGWDFSVLRTFRRISSTASTAMSCA